MSKNYYPTPKQTVSRAYFIVGEDGTKKEVSEEELLKLQNTQKFSLAEFANASKEKAKAAATKTGKTGKKIGIVSWKGAKVAYGSTFDLIHGTISVVEDSPKLLSKGVIALGKYFRNKYESQ